ncbi:MAG: hypothetical protein NTZ73_01120 [Candidatus Diapherotrites archaeon]|nr:hypothetical protein [Candidatus Diapherotrites archaeon]
MAIIFAVIFILLQLQKPIAADEFWYFDSAKSLLQTGKPLLQFCSNSVPVLFEGHPPTYIYYLSIFFALLPEQLIRFSGIPVFLALIFLTYLVSLKVFSEKRKAIFVTALYAINPLAIQGALLLDIDNTILAIAITFFVLILLHIQEQKNFRTRIVLASACFALILWAKTTVIFIISVGLVAYAVLFDRKKIKENFVMALGGIILFCASWAVFCAISGIEFLSVFGYIASTFASKSTLSVSDKIVTILYSGLKQNILWITIPLSIFFFLGAKNTKNKNLKLFALVSIIAFIQYLLSIPSGYRFPKYMAAFLPMIIIVAGDEIIKIDFEKAKKLIPIILFPGAVFFALLRDPLVHVKTFADAVFVAIINTLAAMPALFVKRKKEVLLLLYIGTCIYINIFQLTTDSSTLYNYSERGLVDTAQYLKAMLPADSNIYTSGKEIAYYSGTNKYCFKTQNFTEEIEKNCVKMIVLKRYWEEKNNPELEEITKSNFSFQKEFGDYSIYSTNACK